MIDQESDNEDADYGQKDDNYYGWMDELETSQYDGI